MTASDRKRKPSEEHGRALTFRAIDPVSDGEIVIRFVREIFALSFGDDRRFVGQFGETGAGYLAWLDARLAEDPPSAVLALQGETVVGLVVTGRYPDDPALGYVYHYYLTPSARGRGLASVLDRQAMTTLCRRGFVRARLSVSEANAPALRFYLRQGWTVVGPRPDQPGVIFMERATSPE
ncbi:MULTISPECIES: GNAT family N-acetyltransferase [unclassified Brevundimonas]|jgi:ribosomal protein S18 acetylase RimI-like enzyme|uniref:GNAT family N-acetyltransferase n=1 Tax=unclassified Brevundimonas TaxID=2622653 RepID=UPI0025C287A8|nr:MULTISPECIES: GNAT family N-acetyltransferase [unclassified Brevundimonas]